MKLKYTIYGNGEFDKKIDKDMKLIVEYMTSAVPIKDIAAIILGGGYGRGEGGVATVDAKMALYNDYDMFMITENVSLSKKQEYQRIVTETSEKLKDIIGVDVDFGPLKNRSELENIPFTLMYYELKMGHKVIFGDDDVLSVIPDYNIEELPKEEVLNYMLNRGVGLYLASREIEKKDPDNEFVERNIYKALLACGDIFLISKKEYTHSYFRRINNIDLFKDDEVVKNTNLDVIYKKALNYKLKPENNFCSLKQDLRKAKETFEHFYLYAFSYYWNCSINDFDKYYSMLNSKGIKNCKNIREIPKNLILNFKEVGLKSLSIKMCLNYPRYRLFFVLPILIFSISDNKVNTREVLGLIDSSSLNDVESTFIKLWNRFN